MDAVKPYRLSSDDQIAVLLRPRPIDLKIEIVYDDAGGLGRGRVTIATDYLGRMRHGEINTPPSIVGWLEEFYREFRNLSSRGAQSADALDATPAKPGSDGCARSAKSSTGAPRPGAESRPRRAARTIRRSSCAPCRSIPTTR